jgi:hypothetical protein
MLKPYQPVKDMANAIAVAFWLRMSLRHSCRRVFTMQNMVLFLPFSGGLLESDPIYLTLRGQNAVGRVGELGWKLPVCGLEGSRG